MPLFVFYENIKNKYHLLEKNYENILAENEKIFQITQPKSSHFTEDNIKNSIANNKFDEYLELKEKLCIDKRMKEVKRLLKARNKMLLSKEVELRKSCDLNDRVYCLWILDKKNIREISQIVCYHKSAVYNIIASIKKIVKKYQMEN